MSDLESYVRHSLEALRAQADLSYEELTKDWPRAPDERRFARALRAYAKCQDACRERAAGEPECRDSCARAQAALRRKG